LQIDLQRFTAIGGDILEHCVAAGICSCDIATWPMLQKELDSLLLEKTRIAALRACV